MSATSEQGQVRDPQPGGRGPHRGTARSMWNWFGAAFGLVVLVGASILYVVNLYVVSVEGSIAAPEAPAAVANPVASAQETVGTGHDGTDTGDLPVIEIEMNEFSYVPASVEVPAGTPVILRVTNTGAIVHEAMLGDAAMQDEFAAAGEDRGNSETMAITVDPGETGDLKVTLDEPGETLIGCHLPGHWEAGMVAAITVTE